MHTCKPFRHLLLQLGALLLLFAGACDNTVKTDEALISDAVVVKKLPTPTDTFKIDTTRSEVTWIGAKITGRHNGLIDIQEGNLYMTDGLVTGGNIELNMLTVRATDKSIDESSNQKLTAHLRSPDFFDIERYPSASFELTGIAPYDSTKEQNSDGVLSYDKLRVKNPSHRITGNLTIRSQTKSISFPARVTQEDSLLRAKANFNIDRTKWGLVYGSDNTLGNKTIRAEVNVGLDIVATRKTR